MLYHYWVPSYILDSSLRKGDPVPAGAVRSFRVNEEDILRMTRTLDFPGDDFAVVRVHFNHSPVIFDGVQFISMFMMMDATVPYSCGDLATIFGTIIRSAKTSNNGNFYHRSKSAC